MSVRPSRYKRIRHIIEGETLRCLSGILGCLSFEASSHIMGKAGRVLGCLFISKNRQAKEHLRTAFPDRKKAELHTVLMDMWENLGRYVGELSHISRFTPDAFLQHAEVTGEEYITQAQALNKGVLFFSGHMGNWELGPKAAWAFGFPTSIVYRPLNNPYTDALILRYRNRYQAEGLPKGTKGNRQLLRTLKAGGRVGILIDQKFSGGIPVPFFGRPAMTSPAIAELALRYGTPIVPCRVERLEDKTRFRVTFYPPIMPDAEHSTPLSLMTRLNQMLETWIRERPEQWFWMHRRWEIKPRTNCQTTLSERL